MGVKITAPWDGPPLNPPPIVGLCETCATDLT